MYTYRSPALLLTFFTAACQGEHEPTADDLLAWEEAHEETISGKADDNRCSGVLVPDRNGFAKRVALTFDDGPNLETTPEVLDILQAKGIRATFFINGMRVTSEAHQQVLDRIVDEGHILANHSQHHKQLSKLGSAEVESEIRQTHDIIAQHVDTPRYFRFPFGASTCATAELARSFGYVVTGWHVDSADWCYAASKGGVGFCDPSTFKFVPDSQRGDMVGFTVDQVVSRGGGIVLFHDIHANTVAHLEEVIEALTGRGFSFTNLDDAGVFPGLNQVQDARAWIGTPCATSDAKACQFEANGSLGVCHEFAADGETHGFCSLECEGFCPDRTGAASTLCVSLDGGISGKCLVEASATNDNCADIPGTTAQTLPRFVGMSSAIPKTSLVCAPTP